MEQKAHLIFELNQFEKCQTISRLYSYIKDQEKNLEALNKISSENFNSFYKEDEEAKIKAGELLMKFCIKNLNTCVNSFSQEFIKKTVGKEKYPSLIKHINYLLNNGPVFI